MTANVLNNNPRSNMTEASLRTKIKRYKQRVAEIENYLMKNPKDWGKFQNEFNSEINEVFRDIMNFEKRCLENNDEEKIYKLRRIFINKIRGPFERGDYIKWVLKKPYGYNGDFKCLEDIYENNPMTLGFDRLFDNYFMMSAISIAVRNRKDDFKRMIIDYIKENQDRSLRIMDLASGPCREIYEMLIENKNLFKNVTIDCYDSDKYSLEYSKNRLNGFRNINFYEENAARIAFRKDITNLINKKYDIIFSTGLFDYFEERIALRLIQNLKKLLNPQGQLMISDVRDKFSNSSLYFMEWVGEWELVYRDDESFRNIFYNAGFNNQELEFRFEQQGILQYIIATKI